MVDSDSSSADSVEQPSTEDREPTHKSGVSDKTNSPRPNKSDADPPSPVPGSLFGPYRLESKLGEGGMGAVYKATHTKLGKTVAVKVLPRHLTKHKESVARFEREMKAVGKLSHPHIVQAHDAGEVQGTHFIAMEYIDGIDLAKYVKQRGPMTVINACKVVRQAALALTSAHAEGLIHRDLKPSNILLARSSGQIKLLDLGLARLVSDSVQLPELTLPGEMFGTPDYMAPEQWANSHTADERADLYALGCTLFFLLIGRAPYGDAEHRHPLNKMSGHAMEPIPDLKSLRADVPDGVVAVYRKLMAKHPSERYQNAKELADALQPFASSRTATAATIVETLPVIVTEPALPKKPPVKSSRIALFGGLAGLALLAGIVIIITNKDGTKTKVEVPAGTQKVEVTKDGKTVATVAPTVDEPITPTAQRLKFFMQQREVAEFVLSRGGNVYVEWEADFNSDERESFYQPGKEIPAGAFMVRNIELGDPTIVGADLARLLPANRVNFLTVNLAKLTKEDAIHLSAFPRVHEFALFESTLKTSWLPELVAPYSLALSPEMVDDHWAFLGRCPNLRHLIVSTGYEDTMIPDLLPLAKQTQLRWLELRKHDIAPDVLDQLQRDNPRLLITTKDRLVGRNPMIEPARKLLERGVQIYSMGKLFDNAPKAQLLTLENLAAGGAWRISDVRFDDQHLAAVEDVRDLTAFAGMLGNVVLYRQRGSDDLARALAELGFLYGLTFAESDLTDAGLAALERFDKLRYLDVRGNPAITQAGIDAFHQAVPACRILNDHDEIASDLAAEPQTAAKKPDQ